MTGTDKASKTGAGQPSSIDVAKAAGVSQSAVSRTYTPGASVSTKTRNKVLAAAAVLGYQPNLIPRIMATGRSEIVAVVAGGFYNPFFNDLLETLARHLRDAGKQVMLVHAESDLALDGAVSELARYRVDAVVTPLSIRTQGGADTLSAFRIPIVTLNAGLTGGLIRAVVSDSTKASAQAARVLHDAGGTSFAYVGGPSSPQQDLREKGFLAGLKALGVRDYARAVGDFDYGGGFEAAAVLFSRGKPDAIYCMNDLAALGVMDGLRTTLGLRVPEDVQVIGYDNIAMAAWPTYDLTTFDQNKAELVAGVMRTLHDPDSGRPVTRVPPSFIPRRSTRRSLAPVAGAGPVPQSSTIQGRRKP